MYKIFLSVVWRRTFRYPVIGKGWRRLRVHGWGCLLYAEAGCSGDEKPRMSYSAYMNNQ